LTALIQLREHGLINFHCHPVTLKGIKCVNLGASFVNCVMYRFTFSTCQVSV
jgi:hypothetical protein